MPFTAEDNKHAFLKLKQLVNLYSPLTQWNAELEALTRTNLEIMKNAGSPLETQKDYWGIRTEVNLNELNELDVESMKNSKLLSDLLSDYAMWIYGTLGSKAIIDFIKKAIEATDFGSSDRVEASKAALLSVLDKVTNMFGLYGAIANAKIEIQARRSDKNRNQGSMRAQIDNYTDYLTSHLAYLLPVLTFGLNKKDDEEKKSFLKTCADRQVWEAIGNVFSDEELKSYLGDNIRRILTYKKDEGATAPFVHGDTVNNIIEEYFGIRNMDGEIKSKDKSFKFDNFKKLPVYQQAQIVSDAIDALLDKTSKLKVATSYLRLPGKEKGTYNDQLEFVAKRLYSLLGILKVRAAQKQGQVATSTHNSAMFSASSSSSSINAPTEAMIWTAEKLTALNGLFRYDTTNQISEAGNRYYDTITKHLIYSQTKVGALIQLTKAINELTSHINGTGKKIKGLVEGDAEKLIGRLEPVQQKLQTDDKFNPKP